MIVKALARAAALVAPFVAAISLASPASARPALVADLESGKVIYAQEATDPWFPASVTKLMTAYVVFKAIQDGKTALDTPFTVSERALAAPPSKIGVKVGLQVTVDNALKMIMVKSANDMAIVLAEGVGGSVEGFSDMMNAAAEGLGMKESHFVNPHGLPDERNRTSARDLAILARALVREFPKYQGYFSIDAIKLGHAVMRNHNGLMGRYPGSDGMKTGFICASGFNVVATATRANRRLVVVVLGSPSATERTIKAANLFDKGFADPWGGYGSLEALPASQSTTPKDIRDKICGKNRNRGEEEEELPTPVEAGSFASNPILGLLGVGRASPAAGSVVGANGRTLAPRAAYTAIPVFVGTSAATAVADAVVVRKFRGKKRKGGAVASSKPVGQKAAAENAGAEKAAGDKATDGKKATAEKSAKGADKKGKAASKASNKSEGDKAAKPKGKAKSAALEIKQKQEGSAASAR